MEPLLMFVFILEPLIFFQYDDIYILRHSVNGPFVTKMAIK